MKTGVKILKIGEKMKLKLGLLGAVGALLLIGCGKPTVYGKADKTPYPTKECLNQLSSGSEIIPSQKIDKIVVYKKKRRLYTYRNGKMVDEFRISLGSHGGANGGNKVQAGDYRTPEGTYSIVRKKCDNRLYRSLMISYPNAADKARAAARGVKAGGYITIHGQPKWNADGHGDDHTLSRDWTEGCMAVSNRAINRLWVAVENGVLITINS
jgi:murein L,D-transpeptidase YafK